MFGVELTEKEMERLLERQMWLQENVLGNAWDSQDYIFKSQGGYDNFYKKWLWEYVFPEKFKRVELMG